MTISVETTIAGGLPVLVEGTICPAEPDVGIFQSYVDEICVYFIPHKNGKKHPVPDRLLKKANIDTLEDELIEESSRWNEPDEDWAYEDYRDRYDK